MARGMKIQPVPPSRQREALCFLVAGDVRNGPLGARVEALATAARRAGPEGVRLWWARRRRRCLAAAMVVERPGGTGMLFRAPPGAPGVDREALTEVVRAISESALSRVSMVQAFVAPGAQDERAVLADAGFEMLVELVNIRRDLSDGSPPPEQSPDPPWSLRGYEQFDDSQLGEVISRTYAGSLDCPALCGVRPMADVLAAHKTSGVFRPESWWIFDCAGEAAGCILVNAAGGGASGGLMEVVYLGVCPRFRGRGLGRRMLRYAAGQVARDGAAGLKLAVDSRNVYARKVYDQEGFWETDRTVVMARLNPPAGEGESEGQVERL